MILFVLPVIQMLCANLAVGRNIKGMQIAIKNDEINSLDCSHAAVSGCILDEARNQKISCVVINYLLSLDYQLVSVKNKLGFIIK